MLAVPVYALFPVAPPRLADIGLADTVSEQTVALTDVSTIFYNPLAAVPSPHGGFAAAIGVAVAASLGRRPPAGGVHGLTGSGARRLLARGGAEVDVGAAVAAAYQDQRENQAERREGGAAEKG